MQSFKTIVQIQKFSKNMGIHFAVGKCKGERKKYRLCLMLFRKKLSSLTVREIAEVNTCKCGRAGKHIPGAKRGKNRDWQYFI